MRRYVELQVADCCWLELPSIFSYFSWNPRCKWWCLFANTSCDVWHLKILMFFFCLCLKEPTSSLSTLNGSIIQKTKARSMFLSLFFLSCFVFNAQKHSFKDEFFLFSQRSAGKKTAIKAESAREKIRFYDYCVLSISAKWRSLRNIFVTSASSFFFVVLS